MPCCSGSPTGIYVNLTALQLDELEAGALARINGGSRTSLSGGAKSGSKEWVDPNDVLKEVLYARRKLGLVPQRVTKTYGNFTGTQAYPLVANEQV